MSTPPSSNITLKIVKKDKNSPFLSIQTYIQRSLINNQQPIDVRHSWNKYKMLEAHSLLIKNHKIDYLIFKEIAETILESYQAYHLDLQPDYIKSSIKIDNNDLIAINV